ncbi:RegA translational repressor protein [Aeromonas phage Aeh1]|uniref:Translation repressor protein n=1 Tax=Aeromonas phage Aeh1 TaxID=2880362 RepID=Q76Z73_9CAUD|nr:translation repressor protein [Aeromonas phage Aeh1]AAQ17673.1 RegA translational repressor protein [Aeromonas phage Aeh1]
MKMMLQIQLKKDEDFLKIRETLTRIGIANNVEKRLYQSCHILQKQGKYYIVHFKELLQLDGRQVEISQEDIDRRNDIAVLLKEWGMCDIVSEHNAPGNNFFRVISHKDKANWTLVHKYKFGS